MDEYTKHTAREIFLEERILSYLTHVRYTKDSQKVEVDIQFWMGIWCNSENAT